MELPDDVIHLICNELRFRRDLSTLFNCAVSSKHLAPLALANLYRMGGQSPGNDEEAEGVRGAQRLVEKWSLFWRSIILGSLGKTLYPYHSYLRCLDLRDLGNLLEDRRFTGQVEYVFFSDELEQFHHRVKFTTRKGQGLRLNFLAILDSFGEAITPNAPLLEQVWGRFSPEAFRKWIPRLPRLQRIELYDGGVLAGEDLQNSLIQNCPNFAELSIYRWLDPIADEELGAFLTRLPEQSLRAFITISQCGISTETCLALNRHCDSLKDLELVFQAEAAPAIPLLRSCRSMERLKLQIPNTVEMDSTESDVFQGLTAWLGECTSLREVFLSQFKSAPAALTPMLLNEAVHLEELSVDTHRDPYFNEDTRAFHYALANQKSLQSLDLRGDGDDATQQDWDVFLHSIAQLKMLKRLEVRGIMDYFDDEAVMKLLAPLDRLEEVYIGGYNITDNVLETIGSLRNLRRITIMAVSQFTVGGLLDFIQKLGPNNKNLFLSVDMADPFELLSREEETLVRAALSEKVNGLFEYQAMRDPDISEFEGESD